MRILIVSTFFPPRNSVASLRPYSWAKYWTRAGHDVTVLTVQKDEDLTATVGLPPSGAAVWEVPAPLPWLRRAYDQAAATARPRGPGPGSTFVRWLDRWRSATGVLSSHRMPDRADLWTARAVRAAREGRWDLAVSTSGPYATHVVAQRLKRAGAVRRWVADYRDLWTDEPGRTGLPLLRRWERRLEDRLLGAADAVTTVSRPLADVLERRRGARVHVVENGFDPADLEALDPAPVFPPDGRMRAVYTGSLEGRRNAEPLLAALAEMAGDPSAAALLDRLEVVVAAPTPGALAGQVERLGLGRWVRLAGFVSRPVALRMQRDADFLLFLPWNDPERDGVMTGKIYEYLHWGAPILLVGSPSLEASQRLALSAGVGVRLPTASDVKSFLLTRLAHAPPARRRPPAELVARYDRRALALRLLRLAAGQER